MAPPPPALVERAAAAAHAVLRAYRAAIGEEPGPAWGEIAPAAAARQLVEAAAVLAGEAPPEDEAHRAWVRRRTAEGWRWAERVRREERRHPGMCPWEVLPAEQRAKAVVWRAALRATAEALASAAAASSASSPPAPAPAPPPPPATHARRGGGRGKGAQGQGGAGG
jgi:hypothetical protein